MRVYHWIVLVLLAALTTGCIGWADAGERPGSVTGQARVVIGGVSFPVYEAKVAASGATNAVAWTQRDGAYRLTFLRKGSMTCICRRCTARTGSLSTCKAASGGTGCRSPAT